MIFNTQAELSQFRIRKQDYQIESKSSFPVYNRELDKLLSNDDISQAKMLVENLMQQVTTETLQPNHSFGGCTCLQQSSLILEK